MEPTTEANVKEEVIDESIKQRQDYEDVVALKPTDFYAKQIVYGDPNDTDMLTKVAMLVGLGMIEKYGLNEELSDTVAQSQYQVIASISNHDADFFAKAFFHKSNQHEPVGVMFGNYMPDIHIAISDILYVKPEFRMYNLESRLIDNFTYWSKNIKRAIKTFIERAEEV